MGCQLGSQPFATKVVSPPLALIVATWSPLSSVKAILVPSGDHAGPSSISLQPPRWWSPEPSAFTIRNVKDGAAPSQDQSRCAPYTSFVPSGDQSGVRV